MISSTILVCRDSLVIKSSTKVSKHVDLKNPTIVLQMPAWAGTDFKPPVGLSKLLHFVKPWGILESLSSGMLGASSLQGSLDWICLPRKEANGITVHIFAKRT